MIAAVWGRNSQGKSSLAEAFEFLLTGKIVRRELTASSQDEFADALRNAHLAVGEPVFVEAVICSANGEDATVRRTLTGDYGKRQNCTSSLEINGAAAQQGDLARLGIVLSQPPLEAPVLAQHTLSYLFSARPQDRATYFKTLLEVTDLERFRDQVSALETEVAAPANPILAKFDACSTIHALQGWNLLLSLMGYSEAEITEAIDAGARSLIEAAGRTPPQDFTRCIQELKNILIEKRAKAFPVNGFNERTPSDWRAPSPDHWTKLEEYLIERQRVDEQTRQLVALFNEALKIPSLVSSETPEDCPLCGTADAITPERVALIRKRVGETQALQDAESQASRVMRQLENIVQNSENACAVGLPQFLKWTRAARKSAGFTAVRLRSLLGEGSIPLISSWIRAIRRLRRAATRITSAAAEASAATTKYVGDLSTFEDSAALKVVFTTLGEAHSAFVEAQKIYAASAHDLTERLNPVLDAAGETAGWQDFIDIAEDQAALRAALIERSAYATALSELQAAVRDIDKAKEKVLDDKFAALSAAVQGWWNLLRPEEPIFFSALAPRPGARRTIDLKAGLSPTSDRSTPKIRDVIAVFSQSQLHCLGLALFLARAEHEQAGFVVLDDPILSSDEDYRVHFNTSVLERLIGLPIQVILLTQDQKTWRDLENLYRHINISMFQIVMENPSTGALVENTSDDLVALIDRAAASARGGHPALHKMAGKLLRDAGERFCKEVLVRDRRARGEQTASLSDYDGKTLEWLCPRVEPLLALDPSHPGKLQVFRGAVNPPSHDDDYPSQAAMKSVGGDLRRFVKDYLGR
jgi:hypothetical protein